ncbi:MAG: hypothetical protein WCR21_08790, partial [Bacteroidota bacterium]
PSESENDVSCLCYLACSPKSILTFVVFCFGTALSVPSPACHCAVCAAAGSFSRLARQTASNGFALLSTIIAGAYILKAFILLNP